MASCPLVVHQWVLDKLGKWPFELLYNSPVDFLTYNAHRRALLHALTLLAGFVRFGGASPTL